MPKHSQNMTTPDLSQARQHGHAIEAASANIEILMQSIYDKLGQISDVNPQVLYVMNAISCYADCALKQLEEINQSQETMMSIIAHVLNGGDDA